jgi:LacI family transcriptional regulator
LRRFAFCGVAIGEIRILDLRRELFIQQVQSAGFKCEVFVGVPPEPKPQRRKSAEPKATNPLAIDWETEQEALADWVRSLPKPIGIMACHDPRGYQLVDACRRAGVRVPEQVAVVGVDNDAVLCSMADPPLTSVDPDGPKVGYAAAEYLDRMMRGESVPLAPVLLEPKGLVARRSSDMLAIDDPDLREAIRFIRDHACEGIRVPDVVKHVAMSRSVFERRFRQFLGRTPKAEMLRVQLGRAKQLLVETDLQMAEIARRTGFASDKYFSDAFWHQTGQRPTTYRDSVRRK